VRRVPTKKRRVQEFAASRGWTRIGETEWRELTAALPDVSETTIRESGLAIEAPWSGIRQHTLEELESSLDEFSGIYASRPDLRPYCREQVIAAKDHARWAARSQRADEVRRKLKAEMVVWMLVWLDDPAMFPEWARLRRDKIGNCSSI
jgi:hypothetical protein